MNGRKITYAAGGVVWRDAPDGREVLLILRPKNQDWSLPKGHIEKGESWDAAAQREVKEETGYDTVITGFAGYTAYNVKSKPKVVFYWHMEPEGECEFEPNHEVLSYEWVSALEAVDRLTYEKDKELLRRLVKDEG
jgi:8-oxo-dGTP pyrophosphatase MutT (NUDIX family)